MRCSIIAATVLACLVLAGGCAHRGHPGIWASGEQYEPSRLPRLSVMPTANEPGGGDGPVTDVDPAGGPGWLAMAAADAAPRDDIPDGAARTYEPWQKRRGPAYPGDFWRSFGRDAEEFPYTLWDDTKATFTDKWTLVGLSAAAAVGVAIDVANWNGCVADHYSRNGSQLNGFWDGVGDVGGNPGLHFGVAGAMYLTSLYRNDVKNYEVSKALINALAINGLTTLALKGIANSDSPNGDRFGWPSGHTSSTFCFATVMHEAYGPWVGVPLFAFASFVGYERVDAQNHDFNDVISGALIGVFIGHVVYNNHQPKIFGMDVMPYTDPSRGAVGIALSKRW